MLTHPLAPYFWIAYHMVIGSMLVWTVLLFFKRRLPASKLMLFGGLAGTISNISAQVLFRLASHLGWNLWSGPGSPPSSALIAVEALYGLGVLGALCFHIGLLMYALRLGHQSRRLEELEAILAEQDVNSPLPASPEGSRQPR